MLLVAVGWVESALVLDRVQVLLFRAGGHNLGRRLSSSEAAAAVGAVGMRDAHGSASLSLHARVEGVTQDAVENALAEGALIDVISARGTDTLVPAEDVAVFTLGTLPADEQSLRVRLKPFLPDLDRSGHSAVEALELAKTVARETLAAGPVNIGALSGALTDALPQLSPMCRGRCGVAHIEQALFDLVGESGLWRHAREDGVRTFVALNEPAGREAARAELVRRYLRAYGPSTAAQFAEWCGIGAKDATRSLTSSDSVEVADGRYLLAEDQERLESPTPATGLRILPPRDPYLLDRDRSTLVPDREVQRRLWRANPTDGVILADGEPVATWRPHKRGKVLRLNVQPFAPLNRSTLSELDAEAAALAPLRHCTSTEISL